MSGQQPAGPPTVKPGDTVKIHFTCTLDDGTIFATTRHLDPLEFTVGNPEIISGLQDAVLGMAPGEIRTRAVPPEKSYGPYHEDMVATIDRALAPSDLVIETGLCLRVQHADGHESEVLVTAVTDTTLTVDGNHPLAGKNLSFEIELLELREA